MILINFNRVLILAAGFLIHEFIKEFHTCTNSKLYLRFMHFDEQFMARALLLAAKGKGHVAPNPMVGAVIVHEGKIIGVGYHECYGQAHAEVNAIASVEEKSLLTDATIYVTLEPCAHFGNTPPCADLLAESNFKRVVVGARDPHSKVDGKGIEIIKKAQIEVEIGVLEKECKELNKHFFTHHQKNRPFVMLKWAQTQNGFIDDNGSRKWISAKETKPLVHKWRSEYQSILVGRRTVENDNPSLTVREIEGNNPVRIVIDPSNKLGKGFKIFDKAAITIVLNNTNQEKNENIHFEKLDIISPESILNKLYTLGISSVMIEGGSYTLQNFIDANLWDEINVIQGQNEFDSGTKAPSFSGTLVDEFLHFGDRIKTFRNL